METESTDNDEHNKLNFTFAGCGFMGIYHIGVASCLREYAPPHMLKNRISGASAGSMVAALLLCEAPLGMCTSWTLGLAAKARKRSLGPMHPSFSITDHLRKGLEEILPANAHEICDGKLHVSLTRLKDGKNVIIKNFSSREELIQAVLCSAFIPFWSGLVPPLFKGERYIDGGWSDNLPRIDKYTITVSPFAGRSDICPRDDCNNILYMYLANTSIQFSCMNLYRMSRIMFPPHPGRLSEICKQGFEDALAFLKKHNLVNCSRHLAVKSVLSRRTQSVCFDEEPEEDDADGHCEHCVENHGKDRNLHPSVVTALDEAIEMVNSSYVLYVKNTKPYRTLSVIFSPLYLPFDVTFHSIVKFFKWLPRLHHDIKWIMEMTMWYAKLLSGKVITRGRHTYTAKFVCQLAITEFQHTDIMSDMVQASQVLTSRTEIHDQRIGFGLGVSKEDTIELVHDLREKYLAPKNMEYLDVKCTNLSGEVQHTEVIPDHHHHHQHFHHHLQNQRDSNRSSAECSRRSSKNVSRAASRVHSRRPSDNEISVPGSPSGSNSDELCSQYIDTFDQCVQVADHREAILAYYYKDELGQLKTTEIFKLDQDEATGRSSQHPHPEELVSALAAKKLKVHGSTRSVISAVEMEENMEAGDFGDHAATS